MIVATVIVFAVALYTTVRFAVGSIALRPKLLDRDRLRVLTRFVEAVALLLLVRVLVDWTLLSIVPWFVLVLVTAAGAAAAVLRWDALPWLEDPATRRARTVGFAGTVVLAGAFAGVVGL